ncbi:MAG: biotin--[acetyl-CoA-carboxylase] ligase [Acidimicrobiales bacterium]
MRITRTAISPRFAISTFSNTYDLSGFASHHTGTPPKLSATSQDPSSQFVSRPGPSSSRFREIRRFEELDSTNRYLVDQAKAGCDEGLVAVADYQSAGRGRLGRRWEAPAGANLLVSALLRPSLEPSRWHLLTVAMALAAADACSEVADLHPDLKWPNDLYIRGRKLGGILAESVPDAVVVGMGLNIRWPAPEPQSVGPPIHGELDGLATSIWRESAAQGSGFGIDPHEVLDSLLLAFDHRLVDLDDPGSRSRQAAEYRRRCVTLGKQVRVVVADETLEGTAVDVTDEGHLTLESEGRRRSVSAGDVLTLG